MIWPTSRRHELTETRDKPGAMSAIRLAALLVSCCLGAAVLLPTEVAAEVVTYRPIGVPDNGATGTAYWVGGMERGPGRVGNPVTLAAARAWVQLDYDGRFVDNPSLEPQVAYLLLYVTNRTTSSAVIEVRDLHDLLYPGHGWYIPIGSGEYAGWDVWNGIDNGTLLAQLPGPTLADQWWVAPLDPGFLKRKALSPTTDSLALGIKELGDDDDEFYFAGQDPGGIAAEPHLVVVYSVGLSQGVSFRGTFEDATDGDWNYYFIDVPSGAANLTASLSNLTADVDLFVDVGDRPKASTYVCASEERGTAPETCTIPTPPAGRWWIGARSYGAGSSEYDVTVDWAGDYLTFTSAASGSPNPVQSGGSMNVSVSASDSVGHAVLYAWSGSCPLLPTNGSFADPSSPTTTWKAPTNDTGYRQVCTLTVTVSDDVGTAAPRSSSFELSVDPGEPATIGPGTWTPTSLAGAPSARYSHAAVWADGRMIIWGGYNPLTNPTTFFNTGGLYDPASDTWAPMSTVNAPSPRSLRGGGAIWTGSKMIVWGGYDADYSSAGTGGSYDPVTDTWTSTSMVGAPTARRDHTAVWTGSKMIVWGGWDGTTPFNTGGVYDPATDTWTATSTANAPTARASHAAVWTGSKMIVWGGYDEDYTHTGGIYDPATDTWVATSTSGAPRGRLAHSCVWAGGRMIVWGGIPLRTEGGVFDPLSQSWAPTSEIDVPSARDHQVEVTTGDRLIMWGGITGDDLGTGAIYDPGGAGWTDTSLVSVPPSAYLGTAVWTGSRMIVWGGKSTVGSNGPVVQTGGVFDPYGSPPGSPARLVVSKAGDGLGTVAMTPGDVTCDAGCLSASKYFDPGTVVTLSATTAGSSVFGGWSGGCVATTDTCQVTMSDDTTVTAAFNQPALPDLVVSLTALAPTAVDPGSPVTADYTVTNLGGSPAGASWLKLWLSPDGTLDTATDTYLSPSVSVTALSPADAVQASLTRTIPAGTVGGGWRLIAQVDAYDTVSEANESHNASALPLRVAGGLPTIVRDFDVDLRSDLLWRHTGGALYIWMMNGTAIHGSTFLPEISTSWQIEGIGDFDGDGSADLFWRDVSSGATYLWFMEGPIATGQGFTSGYADSSWSVKGVGDLNGDGVDDVLWRRSSGELYVWLMDGLALTPASALLPPISLSWSIEGLGDFNGDEKTDILWREAASGNTYIWLMDGASAIGSGYTASLANNDWVIRGVGDFDGDGRSDLLWRHTGGALYVWQMDGTQILESSYLPPISTAWRISQLGDYNADGKADILWREQASGNTYVWLMDGPTAVGQGYTASQAGTSWTVQPPE